MKRFIEVIPGKLFRGGAPSPKEVKWLHDNLGIKKIISLDHNAGNMIDKSCKLLGINHVKLYIENRHDLIKLASVNLGKLLLKDNPTFIHCWEGKDRTGLVIALFECKYLGVNPQDALNEAKSLGFGIGVDPKIINLYTKLILGCKPVTNAQDVNEADIVSNQREYNADNRSSFLDESRQNSFAPYIDYTKRTPVYSLYNTIVEQSPTRENYQEYKNVVESPKDEEAMPQVGLYDNSAGVLGGTGPTENLGGFIYN